MSDSPDLLPIVIGGLRKGSRSGEHTDGAEHAVEGHTERILLPEDAQLSVLWAELTGKALAISESYID
jgi:hypothetical protein